jgi:hypothetical protein
LNVAYFPTLFAAGPLHPAWTRSGRRLFQFVFEIFRCGETLSKISCGSSNSVIQYGRFRKAAVAERENSLYPAGRAQPGVRSVRMSPVLEKLLNPGIVWVFIPLAGIALGGIISLAGMFIKHRERMAKIGMGIDPDAATNSNQPQEKRLGDSAPRF